MKVEIWSDYQCPFCYIGKRRFEKALTQFANKDQVEVIYRSFELDPNAKTSGNPAVHDMLAAKYGVSVEQAKSMNADITRQAAEEGLTYHFDQLVLTNSFAAHQLTHFAAQHEKMAEMAERIFKATFTDGLNIGEHDVLVGLAEEVGLNAEEARNVLTEGRFTSAVRADEQEAQALGIRGVPYFVLNRKYAISGAQPTQVFLEALQKTWDEANPFTVLNDTSSDKKEGDGSDYCSDGSCSV